jgi:hypothetical protein
MMDRWRTDDGQEIDKNVGMRFLEDRRPEDAEILFRIFRLDAFAPRS